MLWSKNEWVCAYHWDQPHRIQPEVMVLTPGSPWTGRLQWLVQIPLNQGPPRYVPTGLGCRMESLGLHLEMGRMGCAVLLGLGASGGLSPPAHEAAAALGGTTVTWQMSDDQGKSKSHLLQLQHSESTLVGVTHLAGPGLEVRAPNQPWKTEILVLSREQMGLCTSM